MSITEHPLWRDFLKYSIEEKDHDPDPDWSRDQDMFAAYCAGATAAKAPFRKGLERLLEAPWHFDPNSPYYAMHHEAWPDCEICKATAAARLRGAT